MSGQRLPFKFAVSKPALVLALALDVLLGDPPNRFHPVAWMGKWIADRTDHAARRWVGLRREPVLEFLSGAWITLLGCSLVAGISGLAVAGARLLPVPLNWLVEAVILKSAFSLRGLDRAAGSVQAALEEVDLPTARRLAAWHLVSRDTSTLDCGQVVAAAVESTAENTSDGLVAPLFYAALGGTPLALVYRFANTADAMLGYHDDQHEYLGKFPARFDDALNLIPARLTGWLISLAAGLLGLDSRRAGKIMRRDARLTASPNAGYPMAAMAGALGVELEKVGHYCLGKGQRMPAASDIGRARRVMSLAALLAFAVVLLWPRKHAPQYEHQ